MAEQDAQSCNNFEPQTEMLRPIMTNSTTPPCGVCVQSQTSSQRRTFTLTHFTSQHLSNPSPAQIKQLALAKRQWQRRCTAARASACWEHRWSGQKDTQTEKKKWGRKRIWELKLAADVCHSSLIAVTSMLAPNQAHSRRRSYDIYILEADG